MSGLADFPENNVAFRWPVHKCLRVFASNKGSVKISYEPKINTQVS